jgi:uncharacterized protein with FMN-binding domain
MKSKLIMRKAFIIVAILFIFVVYSAGIRRHVPALKKPSSLISNSANTDTSGNSSSSSQSISSNNTQYKDGTYTGDIANAYYGNVQVAVTISGGKITNIKFLQYPDTHSTSVIINQQAMPYLQQEAIQAQSANVQLISGATFTSQAFIQSLQSALSQS